jgi:hypothetical protein
MTKQTTEYKAQLVAALTAIHAARPRSSREYNAMSMGDAIRERLGKELTDYNAEDAKQTMRDAAKVSGTTQKALIARAMRRGDTPEQTAQLMMS